jgi:hypothetical protein
MSILFDREKDGTIMPEISRFLGIVIFMYFNDHNPPHFHARYGEYEAAVSINDLSVVEGNLPARILGFVIEWAVLHRQELMNDWNLIQTTGDYLKIKPLI